MDKLIAVSFGLVLAGLATIIYWHLDSPIVRVSVAGQLDEAEREQIRDAVRAHLQGGMLSADLDGLTRGILDLSWPRGVSIRRSWPGTLQIDVEKPAVIAGWRDAYLASDGRVVRMPGRQDDLPRFECSLAEPRRAMEIFLVVYRQHLAARIAEIGHIDARYDNGVAVSWAPVDGGVRLVAARPVAARSGG
jgi:cell division septal protein FtsQ